MLILEDLKTRKRSWIPNDGRNPHTPIRAGIVVMKFGEQLRSSVIREYEWYYIDYDGLKQDLKAASGPVIEDDTKDAAAQGSDVGLGSSKQKKKGKAKEARREWTEEDEGRFVERLETELDKVHTKQQVKAMEISRRIAVSEREVKDVVGRLDERGPGQDGPSEEDFMLLEEDLSDIIADVHDLAKFVQLNYTGFYKIIKKHDVRMLFPYHIALHGRVQVIDRDAETNRLASEAGLRCPTESKAFLQGEL
jgi:SPX domain protein involved in polyphosphate accumulation